MYDTQETFFNVLSTLSAPIIKGSIMTINLDFLELLVMFGSALVVLCGFMWWGINTVVNATKKWGEVTGAIDSTKEEVKKIGETIRAIEEAKDDHKAEMQANKMEGDAKYQALETRVSYISNNFLERLEILETLKRMELFSVSIVQEIQRIIGRPIDVAAPDLQTPILRRQQDLSDQEAQRRNRN